MEALILIANLGRVRPVKFRPAGDDPQDKAHLAEVAGSSLEMRPDAISDVVTDQFGRFSQSGAVDRRGGMSVGEEHNLATELETQALKRIAAKIGELVASESYPAWRLVAPQPILPGLVGALPVAARKVLSATTAGDYTSLPLAELEKRFLGAN